MVLGRMPATAPSSRLRGLITEAEAKASAGSQVGQGFKIMRRSSSATSQDAAADGAAAAEAKSKAK